MWYKTELKCVVVYGMMVDADVTAVYPLALNAKQLQPDFDLKWRQQEIDQTNIFTYKYCLKLLFFFTTK